MTNKAQDERGKLKKTKRKRNKRNEQWKYTSTHADNLLHSFRRTYKVQLLLNLKKMKQMSKSSTVDGSWWINLLRLRKQKTYLAQCSTETDKIA